MGTETMGRVLTEATIENLDDLYEARRGQITSDVVRRVTVQDALVDTGTTMLSMPRSLIQQLGLAPVTVKRTLTTGGHREAQMYDTVRLTIMGRSCAIDVLETPDGIPVLIGQIPLEVLDFVVDSRGQRLIGNPAHGGEQMFEMY
jgi:predicted aspartyl protease